MKIKKKFKFYFGNGLGLHVQFSHQVADVQFLQTTSQILAFPFLALDGLPVCIEKETWLIRNFSDNTSFS